MVSGLRQGGRVAKPMRILLLTLLTLIAFASNSILNRVALSEGDIDAVAFVDDNVALHGLTVAGLPVFSPVKIAEIVEDRKSDQHLAPPLCRGSRCRQPPSLYPSRVCSIFSL